MKPFVKCVLAAHFVLIAIFSQRALVAAPVESCSLALAKKYADAVIEMEVKENKYLSKELSEELIFSKSDSIEYTLESLQQEIEKNADLGMIRFFEIKNRIQSNPKVHFFRLKYTWKSEKDSSNPNFYYLVGLKAYESGCRLMSLSQFYQE